MPEVAKNDDISVLPLSNRTQNRLRRAQVHTIGAMLEYPDTELLKLYNMGKKGVEEVRHWVDVLRNGIDGYTLISWREKPAPATNSAPIVSADSGAAKTKTAFLDSHCAIAQDLPIADAPLSIRSRNALKNGGVEYVSQLANFSKEDLLSFKGMGQKSVDEILAYIAKVGVTYHTGAKETTAQLPEECQEIVFQMLRCFGQEKLVWEQELIAVTKAYPESCGETLIYRLYEVPFTRAAAKATVLRLVEENGGELSKSSLEEKLPQHLGNTTILEELLLELEAASAVEIGEVMIFPPIPFHCPIRRSAEGRAPA